MPGVPPLLPAGPPSLSPRGHNSTPRQVVHLAGEGDGHRWGGIGEAGRREKGNNEKRFRNEISERKSTGRGMGQDDDEEDEEWR